MPLVSDPRFTTRLFSFQKYLFPLDVRIAPIGAPRAPKQWVKLGQLIEEGAKTVSVTRAARATALPPFDYQQVEGGEVFEQSLPGAISPASYVATLYDGVCYGRSCTAITADNLAVRESGSFYEGSCELSANVNYRRSLSGLRRRWTDDVTFRRRLPRRRVLRGRIAILNMRCSHNYYHWLLEVMGRIGTLRQLGISADAYLVDCFTTFQRDALGALGIGIDRLIQPHAGLSLQADELLLPGMPTPACLQTFRRELLSAFSQPRSNSTRSDAKRRVYISRRHAHTRRLINEREVTQTLDRHGFESHCLEDYSLARQADLFRSVETVVAPHGAGLANLIFAPPDAKVIEIVHADRYNIDLFPKLSQVFGLRHCQVIAPRSRHRQVLCPSMDDLGLALEMTESKQLRRAA